MTIDMLFTTFLSLSGVAALITVLINIGKSLGWIKDGQASNFSTGFNLVGMIALFVLNMLGMADVVPALNENAAMLANVLATVFGFVWQLWLSKIVHDNVLKGTKLIGKSFSAEAAKAEAYEKKLLQRAV